MFFLSFSLCYTVLIFTHTYLSNWLYIQSVYLYVYTCKKCFGRCSGPCTVFAVATLALVLMFLCIRTIFGIRKQGTCLVPFWQVLPILARGLKIADSGKRAQNWALHWSNTTLLITWSSNYNLYNLVNCKMLHAYLTTNHTTSLDILFFFSLNQASQNCLINSVSLRTVMFEVWTFWTCCQSFWAHRLLVIICLTFCPHQFASWEVQSGH